MNAQREPHSLHDRTSHWLPVTEGQPTSGSYLGGWYLELPNGERFFQAQMVSLFVSQDGRFWNPACTQYYLPDLGQSSDDT